MRLVVVSNRTADPRRPAAGGLAVALSEGLQRYGGLWFGWSGKIAQADASRTVHQQRVANVTLATVDLSQQDHDDYYLGYANSVLWPVFHYRLDLARFNDGFIDGYRRVNQQFAQGLAAMLQPDDIVWIHDYHLIPLAGYLRALGCRQRMGFFLHIPFPPAMIMAAVPEHEALMRDWFAYDLIGFQSHADVRHFEQYATGEGATALPDGRFSAFDRIARVAAFPIGIDVNEFERMGASREGTAMFERMRDEYSRRQLLVGVDRMDYSKGLPQRIHAFRELLVRYPQQRKRATLILIVAPSREDVEAYAAMRRELDGLCGHVNGEFGGLDWMPIRYIHRSVARKRLPGLYRAGRVGLVTPLRDGMNLVAKEYIAAQDVDDPGVLVLSRFAGAAEQLDAALLVNPHDVRGTADCLQRALEMSLEERRERHAALLKSIREYDVHWWFEEFRKALIDARADAAGHGEAVS